MDIEENIQADPNVKDAQVISKAANGMPNCMYWKTKLSGMSDRDCVCTFDKVDLDDGSVVFITKAVEHPDYPPTKKTIRMDVYAASHCRA